MPDAVVIGSGPNGLVGANMLADAGWDVLVLEAEPEPGGAVRSGELTAPGFVHDRFSSFYPLAAASPIVRGLHLEEPGLTLRRHPNPVAHPARDGSVAYIGPTVEETADALAAFAPGDGDAWRRLYGRWGQIGGDRPDALFTPFPPVKAGARLAAKLGHRGLLNFVRFGLLPVRRLADETFRGEGAARLIAGNALHADLSPEQPGSGLYGGGLLGLAQQHGFPVPEGGSSSLTAALVRRLRSRGGEVVCRARVERILVRYGRARGVRTADGREHTARKAILADVSAPALYERLLAPQEVPAEVLHAVRRIEYGNSTFKVDWALDGPVPWPAEAARRAGTIHVAESVDALTAASSELARRLVPAEPFLVSGQYALADPSRQPEGKETFWAYTHVPQATEGDAGDGGLTGDWEDRDERERFADRMTDELEAVAPGFRAKVLGRHITTPRDLEAADANLVGGGINGGTAQLHQQLVFRPVPGLGRAETPVTGLYLASASAHPGGGVHGACGANAARSAIRERGPARRALAFASEAVSGSAR